MMQRLRMGISWQLYDLGLWIGVDHNLGSIQRNSKNLNFQASGPPPIL